jgi:arabinofuranan 3-O-arabinosyltransferase
MNVKSLRKLEIAFLILLGMVPLLWWRPGYIIAKGDYFPFWFNPYRVLSSDVYLWSPHFMGSVNVYGSYLLYGILWLFLKSLGLSIGFIQILIQVLLLSGAGFTMYFLSKTVYPKLKLSPVISSIFYMFNFFALGSRLNEGFAWTYTFLPLLLALLIRIMGITSQRNQTATNRYIIYFAISLTLALSTASLNPANIVLILFVLTPIFLYYLIAQRNQIRPLLYNLTKTITLSILLNIWWTIPLLNYYLWAPLTLNPEVNVTAWAWTHARASFLNLFWLNGHWSWRPEYVPYFDLYSNPILIMLTFIPFLTAAAALLFKINKSCFNAYLMLIILVFLFLAKGLHEPLSQLNLLLYTYIPGMIMFREPASKFTMVLMPFLALLIGYAVDSIANIKMSRVKLTKFFKPLTATFFITTFIVAVYPLVINPVETKTQQIPFSSYIKIPNYWYEAINWLNSQPGDYKILITPPDDFYQMPYTWGYYGIEFFIGIIQKPVLLLEFGYKVNPEASTTLQYLYSTIKYNKTADFKALLDLLNIRYILQRNDIQYNFTGRNIIPPNEMRSFLTQQPYIRLVQKFGQLDIYEYTDPKPYIYILDPTTLRQATIKIENITILNTTGLDLIFKNATQNQLAIILEYKKINPTKITATINATQPFILAISEALDQSWTAYVNGKEIKPTSLYLGLKGFYINQTGLLEITIEYVPQRWFFYGSIISLTTFLTITAYLTITYTRTKNIFNKIKTNPPITSK